MKEDIPSKFFLFRIDYLILFCFIYIATCVAAVFSDIEPDPQV